MPRPGTKIVNDDWMQRNAIDTGLYESLCTIQRFDVDYRSPLGFPVKAGSNEPWMDVFVDEPCVYGPLTESSPTWTSRSARKLMIKYESAWHLTLARFIPELDLDTGSQYRVLIKGVAYTILMLEQGVSKHSTRFYITRVEPTGADY